MPGIAIETQSAGRAPTFPFCNIDVGIFYAIGSMDTIDLIGITARIGHANSGLSVRHGLQASHRGCCGLQSFLDQFRSVCGRDK
jgi:hypothetical protein